MPDLNYFKKVVKHFKMVDLKRFVSLLCIMIFVQLSVLSPVQAETREWLNLPVYFPSQDPTKPIVTETAIQQEYETNFENFFNEVSYGKFAWDVFTSGWIPMPWPRNQQGGSFVTMTERITHTATLFNHSPHQGSNGSGSAEDFDESTATGLGYGSQSAPIQDGFWTPGERFVDLNEDGSYSSMEEWWDTTNANTGSVDGNVVYSLRQAHDQYGEKFADYNGDDKYTSSVNLTIYDAVMDAAYPPMGDFIAGKTAGNLFIMATNTIIINELDLNGENHFTVNGNNAFTANLLDGDRSWNKYAVGSTGVGDFIADDIPLNGTFDGQKKNDVHVLSADSLITYQYLSDIDSTAGTAVLVTANVQVYRTVELFTDTNGDGEWTNREPFEDFLVYYAYQFEGVAQTTYNDLNSFALIAMPDAYITNNYPGNSAAVIARVGNGLYDGPEAFTDRGNTKLMHTGWEVNLEKRTPITYASYGGHTFAGANDTARLTDWWLDTYGTVMPTLTQYGTSRIEIIGEFQANVSRGGLVSMAGFNTITAFGSTAGNVSGNVYPDTAGAYYDSYREFRDLPSSIYHMGGDLGLGEDTDPFADGGRRGTDYGGNYETAIAGSGGIDADQEIAGASPLTYNIHGFNDFDAGNQLTFELMTWRTDGASLTDSVSGTASRPGLDVSTRFCRDVNLDGYIDQGSAPTAGFSNYITDQFATTENNGSGTIYPFDRRRLLEDALEANDLALDYDQFTLNGGSAAGYVGVLYPNLSGTNFRGLSGLTVDVQTRDRTTLITFPGQPGDMSGERRAGPLLAHESLHDVQSLPDFYDYDVWDSTGQNIVNTPVGVFEIMADGLYVMTPMARSLVFPGQNKAWNEKKNLKRILVPGQIQELEFYPIDKQDQFYVFAKDSSSSRVLSTEPNEYFWFWYESGASNYPGALSFSNSKGFYIMHVDNSGLEDDTNQQLGGHFQWQMVQSDGSGNMKSGFPYSVDEVFFPGSGNKTTFNMTSFPKSTWWDDTDSGIEILDIVLPDDDISPAKITYIWKDLDVPNMSFINPPGGTSSDSLFQIRYQAYDIYGGATINIYVDPVQDAYEGTQLGATATKALGDTFGTNEVNVANFANGTYYFYGLMLAGANGDGETENTNYVYPHLETGNGNLLVSSLTNSAAATAKANSTQQMWTVKCISAGGNNEANFSVEGSVTGAEATNLVAGNDYTPAKDYTGITFQIYEGTTDFAIGDTFYIKTIGLTKFSEGIVVLNGAVVGEGAEIPELIYSKTTGQTREGGSSFSVDVRLATKPTSNQATVTPTLTDASEGTLITNPLVFTSDDWFEPKRVTVKGVDDSFKDGEQIYYLNFAISSVSPEYDGLATVPIAIKNIDDETYGADLSKTSGMRTDENGSVEIIDIRLYSPPLADVLVIVSSDAYSEGNIMSGNQLTFTPNNFSSLQQFIVQGIDDSIEDGDVAYKIFIDMESADLNYNGVHKEIFFTNIDNDLASVIVTPISGDVDENGAQAYFDISLSTSPTSGNTVRIDLTSSDLTEGTIDISSILFDEDNYTSPQRVTVTGQDDDSGTADAFFINTGFAVSGDDRYSDASVDNVTVNNISTYSQGIAVQIIDDESSEDTKEALINVSLNAVPFSDVTLTFESLDATEGVVLNSSMTFTADNWNGAQLLRVMGVDDAKVDNKVPYSVVITATGGFTGTKTVNLFSIDNDSPYVLIDVIDKYSDEHGKSGHFNISLSSKPSSDVMIEFSTSDNTEGATNFDKILFSSANYFIPQSIAVLGFSDNVADGHMSYIITSTPTGDAAYQALFPTSISMMNLDRHTSWISVSEVSNDTSEKGNTAYFDIWASTAPSSNVVIPISAIAPNAISTEVSLSTNAVIINPWDWWTTHRVTITGIDDNNIDGDQLVKIVTGNIMSSDNLWNDFDPEDVSFLNRDDEGYNFNIIQNELYTHERGTTASVNINLTTAPGSPVTLHYSSSDNAEGYIAINNAIVFTPTNWHKVQVVTMTGNSDVYRDGDKSYEMVFKESVSNDTLFNKILVPSVSFINKDDDKAGVEVTLGDSHMTTEGGGSITFDVALQAEPDSSVFIDLATSDNQEGMIVVSGTNVLHSQFTFTTTNWFTPQTVTVSGNDDIFKEANASTDYFITLSVNSTLTSDGNFLLYESSGNWSTNIINLTNLDDEQAGLVLEVPAAANVTTEGGGSLVLYAGLKTQVASNKLVTISIDVSDDSEGKLFHNGSLASTKSLQFTSISPFTTQYGFSDNIDVIGQDDYMDEGNVIYAVTATVAVSNDSEYPVGMTKTIYFSNTDDDTAGILISGNASSIDEGDKDEFTITLLTDPVSPITLSDNSLLDSGNLTISTNATQFTQGSNTIKVTLKALVDGVPLEGTVGYGISFDFAGSSDYNGQSNTISFSIVDKDEVGITLSQPENGFLDENGTMTVFDVVLSAKPPNTVQPVVLDITTIDSTELSVYPDKLNFRYTNWNVPQRVSIYGVDDTLTDATISSNITVSANSGNFTGWDLVSLSKSVDILNLDNESSILYFTSPKGFVTDNGDVARFDIQLTKAPTSDTTVTLNAGGNLTCYPSSVTFTATNGLSPQTIVVSSSTAMSDHTNYQITASGITSYGSANIDIYSKNKPMVLVHTEAFETFETKSLGNQFLWVSLVSQPSADVAVVINVDDDTEGGFSSNQLTFTNTNYSTKQAFEVFGLDDSIVDGWQRYKYNINTVSTDSNYNGLSLMSPVLTNLDDDNASIYIKETDVVSSESGDYASVSVQLLFAPPVQGINIPFTIIGSANETTIASNVLTLTSMQETNLTLSGIDDALIDGHSQTRIRFDNIWSSDIASAYNLMRLPDIALQNTDNETTKIVADISSISLFELASSSTITEQSIKVKLNNPITDNVVLSVASDQTSIVTVDTSTLTFTKDNWNIEQSIKASIISGLQLTTNTAFNISFAISSTEDKHYANVDTLKVPGIVNAFNIAIQRVNPTDMALVDTDYVFDMVDQPFTFIELNSINFADTGVSYAIGSYTWSIIAQPAFANGKITQTSVTSTKFDVGTVSGRYTIQTKDNGNGDIATINIYVHSSPSVTGAVMRGDILQLTLTDLVVATRYYYAYYSIDGGTTWIQINGTPLTASSAASLKADFRMKSASDVYLNMDYQGPADAIFKVVATDPTGTVITADLPTEVIVSEASSTGNVVIQDFLDTSKFTGASASGGGGGGGCFLTR